MTKAEMERDVEQYHSLLAKARSAVEGNNYRKAIEIAVNSWQHVAGMLQYETKYAGKEFSSVETIDLVLNTPLSFSTAELLMSLKPCYEAKEQSKRRPAMTWPPISQKPVL